MEVQEYGEVIITTIGHDDNDLKMTFLSSLSVIELYSTYFHYQLHHLDSLQFRGSAMVQGSYGVGTERKVPGGIPIGPNTRGTTWVDTSGFRQLLAHDGTGRDRINFRRLLAT